jgi:TatD DNase family protein
MKILNYDTHAHIDLYKDMRTNINKIEMAHCYTIIVTNVPKLYKKYIEEYVNYQYVRFALGLHPELAVQYKSQLSIFHEAIMTSRYIGEVGLDFTKGVDEEQIKIFEEIIKSCQDYGGKIISVHSRRAANKTMDIIGESPTNAIILHWFSGTMKELYRAIKMGYYFSVNTNMLMTKKGAEMVKRIPPDRLLFESDAPFTNSTREQYNLDFIRLIVNMTAKILGKSEHDIRAIYSENFTRILKL